MITEISYNPPGPAHRFRHILTGQHPGDGSFFVGNCSQCPAYDWGPQVLARLTGDEKELEDYQHCTYLGEILVRDGHCSFFSFWPELVKEKEKNGQTKMPSKSCIQQTGSRPGLAVDPATRCQGKDQEVRP